jgi:hypothetical protein
MSKHIQKGVDRLFAHLQTNLPAQLTDVETQEGLDAGDLKGSTFIYVKAHVPNDNRSPMIMVFFEAGEMIDQNNRIMAVGCAIVFVYKAGADIAAGELYINRVVTAIIQTITNDPTMSDPQIIGAIVTGIEADDDSADESSTKLARLVAVEMRIHSPD